MEIEYNEAREQQFEYLEEDEEFFSTSSEEEEDGEVEDDGLRQSFLVT